MYNIIRNRKKKQKKKENRKTHKDYYYYKTKKKTNITTTLKMMEVVNNEPALAVVAEGLKIEPDEEFVATNVEAGDKAEVQTILTP